MAVEGFNALLQTPKLFPGAKTAVYASPFQWIFTGAENLQIACANSLPGVTIVVQARVFNERGEPSWQAFDLTPTSDRVVTKKNLHLGACVLTNLVAFATGATPKIGQTFVQVKVVLGDNAAPIVLGTLVQGYVTSKQEIAWPGSPIQSAVEGGGYTREVTGTQPAVQGEIFETVPTGARWELISLTANLFVSNVGAPRWGRLRLGNALTPPLVTPLSFAMPLLSTQDCSWVSGLTVASYPDTGVNIGGLPTGPALVGGAIIKTDTPGGGAFNTDQWSAPHMIVREWLEVQ